MLGVKAPVERRVRLLRAARRPRRFGRVLLPTALAPASACSDDATAPSPSRPASLQIEPASLYFLWVGQSQQLAAEALDQAGRAVEGQTVLWSSSDPSVVTVSPALAIYQVLLVHEIAHLIQANADVFGGSAEKTIWEIEGGATLAEQPCA